MWNKDKNDGKFFDKKNSFCELGSNNSGIQEGPTDGCLRIGNSAYPYSLLVAILILLVSSYASSRENACDKIACSGHGTCVVRSNEPVCACSNGYIADSTGLNCFPSDSNDTKQESEISEHWLKITCSNNGTCAIENILLPKINNTTAGFNRGSQRSPDSVKSKLPQMKDVAIVEALIENEYVENTRVESGRTNGDPESVHVNPSNSTSTTARNILADNSRSKEKDHTKKVKPNTPSTVLLGM